jgi:1-acyl-sn-glycerol-3-phosphate acyltransferase
MEQNSSISAKVKTYPFEVRGWYRVVRGIIGFLFRLLCRLEIAGLEHVPTKGPFLYIANHLHWLDAPLLSVTLPCRGYAFAAEKWEDHWFVGRLFRSVDAIFVNRGEVDRKALREALNVLEGGGVLGVAPEGTRSKTGALQKGRSGPAYMALRTGVKLLPTAATGQENLFPSLRRFRRARVRVVYGPPFEPPQVAGKASSAQVHAFTEEIMYHLAAMLPPAYRGLYADVEDKRPDLMARYSTKATSKEGSVPSD